MDDIIEQDKLSDDEDIDPEEGHVMTVKKEEVLEDAVDMLRQIISPRKNQKPDAKLVAESLRHFHTFIDKYGGSYDDAVLKEKCAPIIEKMIDTMTVSEHSKNEFNVEEAYLDSLGRLTRNNRFGAKFVLDHLANARSKMKTQKKTISRFELRSTLQFMRGKFSKDAIKSADKKSITNHVSNVVEAAMKESANPQFQKMGLQMCVEMYERYGQDGLNPVQERFKKNSEEATVCLSI
jgi:hypothetical protein